MIEFREDQPNIFLSNSKKLCESLYDNHLDLHLVYDTDTKSGYDNRFVRVITFENIYDFDVIKQIKSDDCEDEFDFKYFENGGYLYNKKEFKP